MKEKIDVEKEMEEVCEENKIVWTDPIERDSIKSVGFLPLALNEIQKFIKRKQKNKTVIHHELGNGKFIRD